MIDGYSEEFLQNFMEHLRRSHPSTRVSAKVVYNEYIASKDHVHMNSTRSLLPIHGIVSHQLVMYESVDVAPGAMLDFFD